jgi:hypothetical protein
VKGIVVDEQGNPIEGATIVGIVQSRITVWFGAGSPPPAAILHTVSDSAGRFELVVVTSSARIYAHKGAMSLPTAGGVQVTASNREPTLVLQKTAGTAVLHVVDVNGQPLPGAMTQIVVRMGEQLLSIRWGTTKADGTFTLSPIYPDRSYEVRVAARGFRTFEPSAQREVAAAPVGPVAETGPRISNNGYLRIEAGKTIDYPPITLYRTDSFITGVIIDDTGTPLANVSITAEDPLGSQRTATTDAQGRFRIDGFVAGEPISVRTRLNGLSGLPIQVMSGTQDAKVVHLPQPPRSRGPRGGNAGQ